MGRRLAILVSFACACTPASELPTAKTKPVAPEPVEPAPAAAEPKPVEPKPDEPQPDEPVEPASTPVYVMLSDAASRTIKPVAHAVFGHSWGWDTATDATIRKCEEENAGDVGKVMWCSTEDKPAGAAKLVRKLRIKGGRSAFAKPEDVAGWGIAPPPSPIWLVGPAAVCEAKVGRPLVGYYSIDEDGEDPPEFSDPFMVLELAWELTGCDAASGDWAPVGLATTSLDPELRWVPRRDGPVERFDPSSGATAGKGVQPDEIARIAKAARDAMPDERVSDVPEWTLKTFEIPGTKVREIYVGAVWRDPSNPVDPTRYACGDTEFGEVVQYRLDAKGATVIGRGERGSLRGALVGKAGRVHSLVWNDGNELAIARLRGAKLGESTRLSTGSTYPESVPESDYPLVEYCGP